MQALLTNLTEAELAVAFNQGNSAAFTEIYERYWPRLYQHARRMLKDPDLSADAVQDIFMRLLARRGTFELRESIAPFLYQGLRRLIISQIRHEKVKSTFIERMMHSSDDCTLSTDEEMIAKELERLIDRETDLLPPRMREMFRLSREENLSHREIAERTGTSEGTVKKQVYFALKILRGKITVLVALIFCG
jgi:RNA polymerase sigma-70 factor (family 1)